MKVSSMSMLQLQHVLVLLHTLVLIGLIKLIAKSGMLMEAVLGMLVTIVLITTETNLNVNDTLDVLMRLRIVPFTMVMSLLVRERLAVLGVVTIAHL